MNTRPAGREHPARTDDLAAETFLVALADMSGVTSIGPTQDELGRPGTGITITGPHGLVVVGGGPDAARAGALTRTLIIDPATSHILSDQTRTGRGSEPAIDALTWRPAGPTSGRTGRRRPGPLRGAARRWAP